MFGIYARKCNVSFSLSFFSSLSTYFNTIIMMLVVIYFAQLRYRDSELYLMRFRQCMTRGLNLIKTHFIGIIKGLGIDIAKKSNQVIFFMDTWYNVCVASI